MAGTWRSPAPSRRTGPWARSAAPVRRRPPCGATGIRLFLVPREDYADAVEHAGKDLKVVAVGTVDEALAVLADHGGNGLNLPPVAAEQPAAAA